MKKDQMMEKVMSFAMKVQQNKYLSAISTGLMGTLPILMIGSIALLLAVLPIDAYKEFITNIGLRSLLSHYILHLRLHIALRKSLK